MALFNEIQVGRFSAMLQKICSIKGAAPAPQLAGEIMPTLPLEVDRPEWKYLANERLAWGAGTQAAVVGEKGHVQLYLPADAGDMLLVVERIHVAIGAGGTVFVGHLDAELSGGSLQAASGFRDGRLPRGSTATAAEVRYNSYGANQITTVLAHLRMGTNIERIISEPIVLTRGTGVCLACTSNEVGIYVTFFWRERKIELDELLE